jgi:hypothetical protein
MVAQSRRDVLHTGFRRQLSTLHLKYRRLIAFRLPDHAHLRAQPQRRHLGDARSAGTRWVLICASCGSPLVE